VNLPAYPYGQDLVWLAIDASGMVSAFITAGEGPIPSSALQAAVGEPNLEEQLHDLPITCQATLLVNVPVATSYLDLAKRGFFVFDWSDIHRTSAQATGMYERVCLPERPVAASALPAYLQAVARATALQSVSFASSNRVHVHART